MTQEEKELLLKDLCARWPYEVKMSNINAIHNGLNLPPITVDVSDYENSNPLVLINSGFRSYLRPMSSRTEEEKKELYKLLLDIDIIYDGKDTISPAYDWLLKNHFDYRGLIPMGLAIEAPEGMYNLKK